MSEDETVSVVGQYPSRLVQQADTGPAQAINRGLELATGDIVCWLNADDAFAGPNVLHWVETFFQQHPEIDVVTGDGYYIEADGRLRHPIHPDNETHMSLEWLRRIDLFLQPATFWRRNSIRLDEKLHYTFDWQLWIDFYEASLNVCYIPQYFALYRVHPGSLTEQDRPLRRREIYEFIGRNGNNRIQRWWCWAAWKGHELDQKLNTTVLRKVVRIVNIALYRVTGGKVSCG